MDIAGLLSDQAQAFIHQYQCLNPSDLMLSKKCPDGVLLRELVQQIKGRQIAQSKIPNWYTTPGILFGESKSLEQCSSEKTASYKQRLISGTTLVDLTGGLGVDSYFLGTQFSRVDYVEPDPLLCKLAENNFKALKAHHIRVVCQTAEGYLKDLSNPVDWVYIDPDRRTAGRRQHQIQDCRPRVDDLLTEILRRTNQVMIKFSPMLDIRNAINALGQVKAVHVVSIRNQCKELVFLIQKGYQGELEMTAANFTPEDRLHLVTYGITEEVNAKCSFSAPSHYLYQPNASLMKLGAFKLICQRYQVSKLHPNSHLYTSRTLVSAFPGRTFKVQWTSDYKPRQITSRLPSKANVTVRNFITDEKSIRKACKLADGGDDYLFATTGPDGKPLIINGQRHLPG
ncbi:MAG: hypothetical protein DHS20C17_08130 [Cyclobacteriaceae bacterium]|nr:MAG: hypothetical protein DHS20C17_08130 [Cyclobacteriaceae bacterium]